MPPILRIRRTLAPLAALVATMAILCIPSPAAHAATSTFAVYSAPAPLGQSAGEPSIGADWKTGKLMYQAGLQTLRIDPATTPPTWTNVGSPVTSTVSLDPILFTDHSTGRTFASQLALVCSLMASSDNDGSSWTPTPIGCGLGSGVDHQTVGGGPFAPGLSGVGYPHTVYYCAQAIAAATCALSIDGGLTFNPAVPVYTALTCTGLHGHLVSSPDGTVYLPNKDCGGKQGAAISSNNGLTWTVSTIPGSATQSKSDPAVAVGSGNTAYLGYAQDTTAGGVSSQAPYVAVSHDHGGTWSGMTDVSHGLIKNVEFPAMVAGDDGRAAMAFLGTTTAGDDQAADFTGVWHLYVATTVDGGATWTLNDATGNDPVQRGCIWLGGGSNTCRNLLDFMGATVTHDGSIVVAFAKGCTGACVTGGPNTYSAVASIAVQTSGDSMFAVPPPLTTSP